MASEARSSHSKSHRDALRSICTEHSGSRQETHQCSRAVVGLLDGSQVPCVVQELSEYGAYLTRSGRPSYQVPVGVGDHVAVHLYKSGNGTVDSMIVDATVTRIADDGGLGLAVRFCAVEQDEDSPYNDLSSDDWMTEVPEIASLAANARVKKLAHSRDSQTPKTPARAMSIRVSLSRDIDRGRVIRSTLWAGLVTTLLALFVLLGDWLGAVL
jgi:hypothetical protein